MTNLKKIAFMIDNCVTRWQPKTCSELREIAEQQLRLHRVKSCRIIINPIYYYGFPQGVKLTLRCKGQQVQVTEPGKVYLIVDFSPINF